MDPRKISSVAMTLFSVSCDAKEEQSSETLPMYHQITDCKHRSREKGRSLWNGCPLRVSLVCLNQAIALLW